MNNPVSPWPVVIGAVIAFVLQIVVAPLITIYVALPNFMMVYGLVVAIITREEVPILAFVMGMLFDLVGGGPLGVMSFLLLIAAFASSRAMRIFANDTLFVPIAVLFIAIFALEILYGFFMVGTGVSGTFLEALAYRSFPCALYDCVVGIIMYPIMVRVLSGNQNQQTEMKQFR